jgi:hypothetical protein
MRSVGACLYAIPWQHLPDAALHGQVVVARNASWRDERWKVGAGSRVDDLLQHETGRELWCIFASNRSAAI